LDCFGRDAIQTKEKREREKEKRGEGREAWVWSSSGKREAVRGKEEAMRKRRRGGERERQAASVAAGDEMRAWVGAKLSGPPVERRRCRRSLRRALEERL
jgi:hypothetical protein